MQGKVIIFKGNIKSFKTSGGEVTLQITADTNDVSLDRLNEISEGMVMVNLEASQTELLTQESEKNKWKLMYILQTSIELLIIIY